MAEQHRCCEQAQARHLAIPHDAARVAHGQVRAAPRASRRTRLSPRIQAATSAFSFSSPYFTAQARPHGHQAQRTCVHADKPGPGDDLEQPEQCAPAVRSLRGSAAWITSLAGAARGRAYRADARLPIRCSAEQWAPADGALCATKRRASGAQGAPWCGSTPPWAKQRVVDP